MRAAEMDELIEAHIKAESAGDTAGAVAVYTDDVVHDVVGLISRENVWLDGGNIVAQLMANQS